MHDYARTLVKHAESFPGYDRPNGRGLVPFVEQYRDDSILDQSNYATVLADLQSIDDRVDETSRGYYGGTSISVPLTDAICEACYRWDLALSNYPVADEMDLSERESADLVETLTNCYDVPSTLVDDVMFELSEHHNVSRSDDVRSDDVEMVKRQLLFTLTSDSRLSEADTIRLATDLLDDIGLSVVLVNQHDNVHNGVFRDRLVARGLRPITVANTPDSTLVVVLDHNDARSLLDD